MNGRLSEGDEVPSGRTIVKVRFQRIQDDGTLRTHILRKTTGFIG